VRRHVGLRRRLVERRSGEGIDVATARARAEAEQRVERVAAAAARAAAEPELRNQCLRPAADIEAEIAAAAGAALRLAERAREVLAWRRDGLGIGRERIPVLRDAAGCGAPEGAGAAWDGARPPGCAGA
jgi:hypothetical protein